MISINPLNKEITIPKSDLTLINGSLYALDTNWLRLALKDWEDSDAGIVNMRTHKHNTEVTIAGTTYARTIEIINGYSITFEDGEYSVRLEGSNNNIFDIQNNILNYNKVQVIPTNSAGLIVVSGSGGGGFTPADRTNLGIIKNQTTDIPTKEEIANAVLDEFNE